MIDKILHTVKRHHMIEPGDTIVIGLSGGSDSMALACFFNFIKEEYALRLIAAHVDHCLRAEESDRDRVFVENWCREQGIEFHCLRVDAAAEAAQRGLSTELCAREIRYDYFSSFGKDVKIATAHHLDDSIETVVFNMCRGTALSGLCGIPPVRDNIIRPLIDCTKAEIERFCSQNEVPFVVDSTNLQIACSRNKIRHQILPVFREVNSSFEASFCAMMESNREDAQYLNAQAHRVYERSLSGDVLDITEIAALEVPLLRRVLLAYLTEIAHVPPERKYILMAERLIKAGGSCQFPGGVTVKCLRSRLSVQRSFCRKHFEIVNKLVVSYEEFINSCEKYKNKFDFFADYDKISGSIVVRQRMEGDRISLGKRRCTKTLKKYFNEMGIDAADRGNIPILCDAAGLIGIVGYDTDERAEIGNTTKQVFLIKVEEKNA